MPSTCEYPSNRIALERIAKIHKELQKNSFPNCRTLAETFEISAKTVQRDIEFMRDRLGLPLVYQPAKRGYHYSEAVTAFPSLQVTEGELFALCLAQRALAQYRGTPFEKPLAQTFEKLAQALPDSITLPQGALDSAISFRPMGATIPDPVLFQKASRAVLKHLEVVFEHTALRTNVTSTRRIRPYHLLSSGNVWYLIGYDLNREALRTFTLGRIQKFEVTKKTFDPPEDFSVEEYLKKSLGVYVGQEDVEVKIRFAPFAAQLVREREWHPNQKIEELPDGCLEFSLTLNSILEIEWWVLSWGRHAEVLEPPQLRRLVSGHAADLALRYSGGDGP